MKAHGLTVTEDMVEYGDYSSEVEDLVEKLLDNNPDAEAIVSANDEMASSAYRVCRKRGLIPGRDIAITGYDDVEFAQRMDPPLTTANQDGLDMGFRALKCAVSLCKDAEPVKMKLPAKFQRRQSCGCKGQHDEEIKLLDVLEKIQTKDDKELIEKAVSVAASDSYQSIAMKETRKAGEEYFRFLIYSMLEMTGTKELLSDKKSSDLAFAEIQKLCMKDGKRKLDFSGFQRTLHQVLRFFMEKETDAEVLRKLGLIQEVTDNYITSFIMRSDENNIMMLMNKSWAAPASIRYMIEKVDNEDAFNRLAIETAIDQGAKSAYLYLLPEPLHCDRKGQFLCPERLELAAEYVDEVKVYDKDNRPVITKRMAL